MIRYWPLSVVFNWGRLFKALLDRNTLEGQGHMWVYVYTILMGFDAKGQKSKLRIYHGHH